MFCKGAGRYGKQARLRESAKNQKGGGVNYFRMKKRGRIYVCHEHRDKVCGTVLEMGVGLPKSAYRGWLQTAQCCCVQKAWW